METTTILDYHLLRTSTRGVFIHLLYTMVGDGDLRLDAVEVDDLWASAFIESILINIPLPAFFFAMDASGTMSIVDGTRRFASH
jgi:hypothetical protein